MKKIIALLMAALILLSLSACSGAAPASSEESAPQSSEASSEAQPSAPEASSEASSQAPTEPKYEKAQFGSVKVINNLGYTLIGLYLSPSHSETWEENVLTDVALPTGQSVEVLFPDGENARYWDMRVVGLESQEVIWYELDMLTTGIFDLVIVDGVMTAETVDR